MDPKNLIDRISIHPGPNSAELGLLINDLLKEFQRGYSVENLRSLLQSKNERLLNAGIWIASELGEMGSPLLNDVTPLLRHPAKRVRYIALDCIFLWAGPSNKADLASALFLMNDVDSAVRWKATDLLSRASNFQLQGALSHIDALEPNSAHARGLRWLLSRDAANPENVIFILRNSDPTLRKYAAVAAVRMFQADNRPFSFASSIDDPDIQRFTQRYVGLTK